MSSIYFYKMTCDDGGAPCVYDGVLSLAICKPFIRSSAHEGDLIFGFAANSLHPDNRLIYVARVTHKLSNGKYYKTPQYRNRGDCIYEWNRDRFVRRSDARFHESSENLAHDLGQEPRYERASVLLSNDFRYFGGDGPADYKTKFPRVKQAVEHLAQGHRVHLDEALHGELEKLASDTWKQVRRKVAGRPTEPASRRTCHRSRACGIVPSTGVRPIT